MSPDQLQLVYERDHESPELRLLSKMTPAQREHRLEEQIRVLARLNETGWETSYRAKRHAEGNPKAAVYEEADGFEGEERTGGPEFKTLRPWAFSNWVGKPVALEAVTLSPHAFISELASPEAGIFSVLTPRAFISTVLSPAAFLARVMSPLALRTKILSPRAFTAYVLSPEALIAEVLSPLFFDNRVLTPEALVIRVLSPCRSM